MRVYEETSLYEHSYKSIENNTLDTNDDMRNHLLSYDVLILEAIFHYVHHLRLGLIHSLGTLTLTDIDNVSIMKSRVYPTLKRGGITGQSDPKYASIHGN